MRVERKASLPETCTGLSLFPLQLCLLLVSDHREVMAVYFVFLHFRQ